jgi:hypothetical protein
MIVERSLANGSMLAGCGVQFVVGSVLKGKQSIVSAGYGQEDLVELALSRALVACLGVLDNEDHGQRKGGYQCLEDARRDAWRNLSGC